MKLELTQDETRELLWSPGDHFEIVPGRIEFTRMEETPPYKWATIMFESDDPSWRTREWEMPVGDRVPNGPALLVLYRKGKLGYAFGVVALTNRAWTHAWPLIDRPFYRRSRRNRLFRIKVFFARLFLPVGLVMFFAVPSLLAQVPASVQSEVLDGLAHAMQTPATAIGIALALVLGCFIAFAMARQMPKLLLLVLGLHHRSYVERIEQSARKLMWRIARDAAKYQTAMSGIDLGKL